MKCFTWGVGEAEGMFPVSLLVPWAAGNLLSWLELLSCLCLSCQGKHRGLMLGQAVLPCSSCFLSLLSWDHLCCPPAASAMAKGRAGGAAARLASPPGSPLSPTPSSSFAGIFGRWDWACSFSKGRFCPGAGLAVSVAFSSLQS